jgi:hypothetical protein
MERLKPHSQTIQTNHQKKDASKSVKTKKMLASPRLHAALEQLSKYAINPIHRGFFLRYLNTDLSKSHDDKDVHYELAMHSVGIPSKNSKVRDLWVYFQCSKRAIDWLQKSDHSTHRWSSNNYRRLEWLLGGDDALSIEQVDQWPITKQVHAQNVASKNLEAWFKYANGLHGIDAILMAYEQLCVIRSHAKDDGHIAGVCLEVMLSDLHSDNSYWVTPLLVQSHHNSKHQPHMSLELEDIIPEWEVRFDSLVDKQRYIYNALESFNSEFDLLLQTKSAPAGWYELKMILLAKPIITMETAHAYLEASSFMFEYGLLKVKHIKTLNNLTVFECPAVFELWKRWENIISFQL